jgi:hypothetical protein
MRSWAVGLLVAGSFAGLTGDALAVGPSLVVDVDEPFVIDGEVFEAGELTLRPVRSFTPTITLNEIWVGDRCLGLLQASRSDRSNLEASRNAVLFGRDVAGHLVLRGFAYRVDGDEERYRYELLTTRDASPARPVVDAPVLIAGPAAL